MTKQKKGKVIQMLSPENYVRQKARKLAIYECWINADWQRTRKAIIIVTRKHDNGNITMGFFQADLLCLGVSQSHLTFFNSPESEYRELLKNVSQEIEMIKADYHLVHNIIYASIEFADEFGFEPDKAFKTTLQYLLEKEEDIEFMDIECGDNYRPFYIYSPDETTVSTLEAIKAQLDETAGHGNYLIIDEEGQPLLGTEFLDDDPLEKDEDDLLAFDEKDMKNSQTFQLKIQIKNISHPPVWRRITVPSYYTFMHLHYIIQETFGWYNAHLFQFSPHGFGSYPIITNIREELDYDLDETIEAEEVQLKDFFKAEKQKFSYIYDFGDTWEHQITLEKIIPKVSMAPMCLAGKGQCPPEDCGGPWGYETLKKILEDPKHKEYEEWAEWLGLEDDETWDPKEFDLEETQGLVALL